ncbi:MAG: metallophosphoesterase family protein [Brevirhabdus sp.]
MRIDDLGTIEGPVLIYGGPYSNLQATQALFERADALGVARTARICTGDVIGYCADPVETWQIVRHEGGPVVAGNVERQLAQRADDCGCGFDIGSACDLLSKGWFPFADAQVDQGIRDQMAALPDAVCFLHHGRRYAVVHGAASDISRFIWPGAEESVFKGERDVLSKHMPTPDVVIGGHSGIAFQDQGWLNAGVIGLPPHDGRPETRFVVLDQGRAIVHRLVYDHRGAAKAMRKAGLSQGYDTALETGVWPSQDVLPERLRH